MRRLPAVLALAALAGCGSASPVAPGPGWSSSTGPRSGAELVLDFEQTMMALGGVLPGVANAGTTPVRTEVVTSAGGRVTLALGVGDGYGARFPAFRDSPDLPAAVIVVHDQGAADTFSPGHRAFRFGADVRLDAVSAGHDADDGDNLVQRGLFSGGGQYKLQLDKGVPSCRIVGARGVAVVEADAAVRRERWYRLACTRHDDEVTLTVWDLETPSPVSSFRADGAVGAVTPDEDLPLAVGGKVGAAGRLLTSSTDQFNGSVDNVHYALLDAGDPRG